MTTHPLTIVQIRLPLHRPLWRTWPINDPDAKTFVLTDSDSQSGWANPKNLACARPAVNDLRPLRGALGASLTAASLRLRSQLWELALLFQNKDEVNNEFLI